MNNGNFKNLINEGNYEYNNLIKYIKKEFVNAHTYFPRYIINNAAVIIDSNTIPVGIITDSKLLEKFKKYNNARIDDDNNIVTKKSYDIITILKKYLILENERLVKSDYIYSFAYQYADIDDNILYYFNNSLSDENHVIMPNENTKYDSVLRNLFYNNAVKFAYNPGIEFIECADDIKSATVVRSAKITVISRGDDVDLPTKYQHTCRAKTKDGIECGNIVEFYRGHLHTNIKCNLGTDKKEGHTIKNPDSVMPINIRNLYSYTVKFNFDNESVMERELNNSEREYLVYSFRVLEKDIHKVNFLYCLEKQPYILILGIEDKGVEDDAEKLMCVDIIPPEIEDNRHYIFLEDIHEHIKHYYKKYHNINYNDKNKIVSCVINLQMLCKLFFNHRYHSFAIGTSGSGKTYISSLVVPLYTINHFKGAGTNITVNRFLGGRSNINSAFHQSPYSPGVIETKDVVILEEVSDILDMMKNPKININDNLFNWIKMSDDNINRGIQGSRDCRPNASLILFGNLEQLKYIRGEYLRVLRRKYTNYTNGKQLPSCVPIYKSPEYYLVDVNNERLAAANAFIKRNYYNVENFITGLPIAEQSRFTFLIALEDDESQQSPLEYNSNIKVTKPLHREEFIKQLLVRFGVIDADVDKLPKRHEIISYFIGKLNEKFKKDIWDYMNQYLLVERNNFRFTKSVQLNSHIFENQTLMITDMLLLQKLYYKQPIEFTDEDKGIIKVFESYNYNILSHNEANMSRRPYINDCYFEEDKLNAEDTRHKLDFEANLKSIADKNKKMGVVVDVDVDNISKKSKDKDDVDDIFDLIK